jgi:homoserine dehydrogenase
MSTAKIVVLKFGSSVLRSEDDLPDVVHEIYRRWRAGAQVLAVVSALGNSTDALLYRAQKICAEPDDTALATLLATGEATASALLTLALNRAGIPARVLNAAQAGLRTSGTVLDAQLQELNVGRLQSELNHSVVVLPGFVGHDEDGRTTLLGRGGSDFSAVFVAQRLGGRCVLVKDVAGLYTSDPAHAVKAPPRFAEVTYTTACRVAGTLVQPKAIRLAQTQRVRIHATSLAASTGTEVGSDVDRIARPESPRPPLQITLLGCGIVGGGVYERLAALPELFTIAGVAVRNASRARQPHVSHELLTEEADALIERPCDVVVELIGGSDVAAELISRALCLGKHVVTANKAVIAAHGEQLHSLARENDVTLRYSAVVGGALPALETIARAKGIGRIRSICGVLNGTTNFVLDQLVNGSDFQDAIGAAQRMGYAEADPTLDLDGTDAAQKLIILARAAFDICLPLDAIDREGVEQLNLDGLRSARAKGRAVRLVASARRADDEIIASVAPTELPPAHPLGSVTGAENRLLIELEKGETLSVSGIGAGRWPTAESVMADLLDVWRESPLAQAATPELEECVA